MKKEQNQEPNEKSIKEEVMSWIKLLVVTLVIGLGISSVIKPTVVSGDSMLPTLQNDNYLLLNRLAYKVGEPKHQDIVVFHSHTNSIFIKRVIGIAGDEVKVKDGRVWVNGEELKEDYINGEFHIGNVEVTVPKDQLFVMGDNRDNSYDSRFEEIGFIHEDEVIGKVFIELYPSLSFPK